MRRLTLLFGLLVTLVLPVQSRAQVIFDDTFTETVDTLLENHVPDLGTSWALITNSANGYMIIDGAGDFVYGKGPGGGEFSWYTANVTYPSANYEVEGTLNPGTSVGTTRMLWLGCRYTATGGVNFDGYGAWVEDSAGTNDIRLYKFVNGVSTKLSTTEDTNPAINDVFILVCSVTSLTIKKNGVAVVGPITDSSITTAGKAWVGAGKVADVTGAATAGGNLGWTRLRVTDTGSGAAQFLKRRIQ